METHLRIAEALATLLDNKFSFGKFKVGLDPLLGLIPGLGDLIPAILGIYIIYVGVKMDLPSDKISKMVSNLIMDFFIGTIPVIGDLTDFFFKSNLKNLQIIKDHISKVEEGEVVK